MATPPHPSPPPTSTPAYYPPHGVLTPRNPGVWKGGNSTSNPVTDSPPPPSEPTQPNTLPANGGPARRHISVTNALVAPSCPHDGECRGRPCPPPTRAMPPIGASAVGCALDSHAAGRDAHVKSALTSASASRFFARLDAASEEPVALRFVVMRVEVAATSIVEVHSSTAHFWSSVSNHL